jgi:hypothetical protein
MPEEHKKDHIGYVGNSVPWWMVLLYASYMVMTFSYLGTFFFRDLADWNADPQRMETDLWQSRDVENPQEWHKRGPNGEYADEKGGWGFMLND